MLSSSSAKAVPVSYTQTSVSGLNMNVVAGFGGDGLLYGLVGGSTPARINLATNTITNISSGSVTGGQQQASTAVSANNIMFVGSFVGGVGWTFYSIGPYTGTPVPVTQLFVANIGSLTSLAVDPTGTTLYVHYDNSKIASYTGWNGTTATATVLSSSVNFNVARIVRAPTGTFYMTNAGGVNLGNGSTVNFTMTPAGVISSMASSVNISGAIAIDGDGLPVITGGSGGSAVIRKLTASTSTVLNGSSFDNTINSIVINPASRAIYVRTQNTLGASLIVYAPNY
jgi:hypothetical protein